MSCNILNLPLQGEKPVCIYKGDTIPKYVFRATAGNIWDFTDSNVEITFYLSLSNEEVYTAIKGDGITVVNANEFEIDKIVNNTFPIGVLDGYIRINDVNGDNKALTPIKFTISKL
jgi:hypothetical protein